MSDPYSLPGLSGRTAPVTGGSRGIGAAIVTALAAQGAKVVYTHLKAPSPPAPSGPNVRAYVCDVRDPERLREVLAETERGFGKVDLLVNNAGITKDRSFKKLSVPEWDEVLEVNLKGVYLTCKEVMPGMLDRGFGRIVNVSSVIAATGNFGQANYAAAKAGLQGLTRALAVEGAARRGLRQRAVPGLHRDRHVRAHPRGGEGQDQPEDPSGPGRFARRDRGRRSLPALRPRVLRHGPESARQWRDVLELR